VPIFYCPNVSICPQRSYAFTSRPVAPPRGFLPEVKDPKVRKIIDRIDRRGVSGAERRGPAEHDQ